MKEKHYSVAVLGGGVAGLTVAWRLAEDGVDSIVVEREDEVGGLSRTTAYKGFLFDNSSHRFNSDNPEVIRRFKQLVGKHCIRLEQKTYIRHWGQYISYPPKVAEVVKVMPKLLLIKAVLDFTGAFIGETFFPKKKQSVVDWTRAKFGKTLSLYFNEQYMKKIWKTDPRHISSEWAPFRVGNLKFFDFILASLSLKTYEKVFSRNHPDSNWFYYSDIGIGYFPKRIAQEAQKLGVELKRSAIASKISLRNNRYRVTYIDRVSREVRTFTADSIVSSIPLDILIKALDVPTPKPVQKAISSLNYLTVLVVNVLLNKKSVHRSSWVYYPDKDIFFNYIMEFKNWSKKMVRKGKTAVSANVTCKIGDETWRMKDAQIIQKVVDDLVKVELIKKHEVIGGFVIRLPYAYPILDLQYKKRLAVIKKHIDKLPNFYLTGRTGNFEYINSDKVMHNGLNLAEKILRFSS